MRKEGSIQRSIRAIASHPRARRGGAKSRRRTMLNAKFMETKTLDDGFRRCWGFTTWKPITVVHFSHESSGKS